MIVFHVILSALMAAVIYYDFTRYRIPNWLVATIAILYLPLLFLSPVHVPWVEGLIIAAAIFVVGLVLFMLNVTGGGDVKLLTVCGLWAGKAAGLEFLIYTTMLGGLLSVALLLGRPVIPWALARSGKTDVTIPRLLTIGEPAPYGLAIAVGFLILLWMGKLPGLPL